MDLNINFEELSSVGTQVSQKVSDFQELLNKISQTNSNLSLAWEGTDASKYTNAVAKQAEEMQKLAKTIDEIAVFIGNVSAAYQKAMQENSDAIKISE